MIQKFTLFLIRSVCILLFCLQFPLASFSQKISLADVLNVSDFTSKRFENTVRRMGFYYHGVASIKDSTIYVFTKRKPDSIRREFFRYLLPKTELVAFQTIDKDEISVFKDKLNEERFSYSTDKNNYTDATVFQKGNLVVYFSERPVDSVILYTCYISRAKLPKVKDIAYADDLLQLTSHQYLCDVFGPENVKKDVFFLSGDKTAPCSVLFPNTKMEAVFIWQDGPNLRSILALRIGGDPQTKGSLAYERSIEQNVWQFREGLYIGMSLQEIQKLNTLYSSNNNIGRRLGQTKDEDKLANIGLILSCMNCGDSKYFRADFASISDASGNERKIYLSTVILLNKNSN